MNDGKRRNLGRGLDALLGSDDELEQVQGDKQLISITIDKIVPSPFQPRRNFDEGNIADLAESIKEKGILQPLIVRQSAGDIYEIIAGERRFRASKLVGLTELPVIIKNLSDREVLEVALVENLQRQDLSPLEEAEGYQKLIDEFGHTQEALAKVVGKSRSHVANMLRLLNLPDELKQMVQKGELSSGHARALLNSENMLELAGEVIRKGLNVRQTENLVRNPVGNTPIPKPKEIKEKDPDLIALERELSRLMGMKVFIRSQGRGGEIAIKYGSLEELDDILYNLGRLLKAKDTAIPDQVAVEEPVEEVVEEIVEEVAIEEPVEEVVEEIVEEVAIEEPVEEEVEEIIEEVAIEEPVEEVVEEIVEEVAIEEPVEEVVEEIIEEVVAEEPVEEVVEEIVEEVAAEEPVEEVVEEIVEEIVAEEPVEEVVEEIIEEVAAEEPVEEVVEEIIEEVAVEEPVEEVVLDDNPDQVDDEDDWTVGLDTVIGLEDDPEEQEDDNDTIPDDAWAKALKLDGEDELDDFEEDKN